MVRIERAFMPVNQEYIKESKNATRLGPRTKNNNSIHKKGDHKICNNYREITLISTTYKILVALIQRLAKATKYTIGQFQCEFSNGKSTVNANNKLSLALKEINLKVVELL